MMPLPPGWGYTPAPPCAGNYPWWLFPGCMGPVCQPSSPLELPIVGACCNSCAGGGTCEGECPSKQVGQGVIEKAFQFSDIADADSTIRKFNEQVVSTPGAGPDAVGTSTGPYGTFASRWNLWNTKWDVWFAGLQARNADIQSKTLGLAPELVDGEGAAQYQTLMNEFNGFVDEFKKLGGKTTVEFVDTRSRVEKAAGGLLEGLGVGASTLGQGLVYIAAIGAVGLGLYYLGPPLLARAASKLR